MLIKEKRFTQDATGEKKSRAAPMAATTTTIIASKFLIGLNERPPEPLVQAQRFKYMFLLLIKDQTIFYRKYSISPILCQVLQEKSQLMTKSILLF